MKQLVFNSFGNNDVLDFTERSIPSLGRKDILVKVAYAGVNPLDWKTRNGELKMVTGRKFPKFLGSEFSGIVTETGRDVISFKPGDRVAGAMGMHGGAFSEFVVSKSGQLIKLPKDLDMKMASVSVVCGLTAYQCLVKKGKIDRDKKILIHGAAGGVGTFAVQIAKIFSAECWGTASRGNHSYIQDLGCNHVMDYNEKGWLETLPTFDLFFDAVSKLNFSQIKSKLHKGGIYVNTLPGPAIFLQQILTGLFFSIKAKTFLFKFDKNDLDWLFSKLVEKEITLPEIQVIPFENIVDAIELSETQKVRGKITIEIDSQLT
jgi:NADPH:quinone reductase-like Zn-dependent oxidoreductase